MSKDWTGNTLEEDFVFENLDDKITIIEEVNKIEKIIKRTHKVLKRDLIAKINEIIDLLNEKEGEENVK